MFKYEDTKSEQRIVDAWRATIDIKLMKHADLKANYEALYEMREAIDDAIKVIEQ